MALGGLALGEALGTPRLQGASRRFGKVYLHKIAAFCSHLQKIFFSLFHEVFLMVPLTTSEAGRGLRYPGSDTETPDQPRALINTAKTLQAKAV